MRTIKYSVISFLMVFISLANAQPWMGPGPGGPLMERRRMPEKIKTIKIWQLTEAVGLTSEQSEKFFPVYNKFEKDIREFDQKKFDILKKLKELSDSPEGSESEIDKNIKKLNSLDVEKIGAKKRFVEDISNVLSVKQVAKLLIFEEGFKRRLREIIQDIRHERGEGFRKNRQR